MSQRLAKSTLLVPCETLNKARLQDKLTNQAYISSKVDKISSILLEEEIVEGVRSKAELLLSSEQEA
jgi:hypothetical protein